MCSGGLVMPRQVTKKKPKRHWRQWTKCDCKGSVTVKPTGCG